MKKYFVIFRNKESKKITKYSVYKHNDKLSEMIDKFNSDDKQTHSAELVHDHDLISALEIAEDNKKTKDYDLRSIESALESVSNEIYHLKEALKE